MTKFLGLVFGAVAMACVLVAGLVLYYGGGKRFEVNSVLLSPRVIQSMSPLENADASKTYIVFDEVEWVYFADGEWQRRDVAVERYQEFYHLVVKDWSLLNKVGKVAKLFRKEPIARLLLKVRVQGRGGAGVPSEIVFQEVDFASDGLHYRIGLHDAGDGAAWTYFRHAGVGDHAVRIFGEAAL